MKLLPLIILILFSLEVRSQKDIIWSDLNFSKSTFYESIHLDGYTYMVKVNKNGFSFSKKNNTSFYKYDSEMKEVKMSLHNLSFASKKITFQKLMIINDQLYFLSFQGSSLKDKSLILNKVDKNTLEISDEAYELVKAGKESVLNTATFMITQSPDKNFLLITAQLDGKGNKNSKRFKCLLFDENLKLTLEEDLEIKGGNDKFEHTDIRIDDTGNIFMIAFENNSRTNDNYPMVYLWRYLQLTKKAIADEISGNKDKPIKSIHLELSGDDMVLGGLYSAEKKSKNKTVRGLVFKSIPKQTEEKIKLDYLPYSAATLHHDLNESKQKRLKGKGEIKEYDFLTTQKVFNWNDDHIVIVGEQIEKVTISQGTSAESYEKAENLIVSCLDKTGDLKWSVPIKKSYKIDPWFNHHSFMISEENDKILIFYSSEGLGSADKGMVMTSIDLAGNEESTLIFSKGEDKVMSCPKFCQKIDSNTYFIYGRNWLKDKFGILTLSE